MFYLILNLPILLYTVGKIMVLGKEISFNFMDTSGLGKALENLMTKYPTLYF